MDVKGGIMPLIYFYCYITKFNLLLMRTVESLLAIIYIVAGKMKLMTFDNTSRKI